jgi:hypothetical protein
MSVYLDTRKGTAMAKKPQPTPTTPPNINKNLRPQNLWQLLSPLQQKAVSQTLVRVCQHLVALSKQSEVGNDH